MAESTFPIKSSVSLGSDQVPDLYCEQCFDITGDIEPAVGYCLNCDESLCQDCYNFHLRPKQYRNHQLVDKSTRPTSKLPPPHTTEKCQRHHEEILQSFCKSHSQICCKVCLAIDHQTCDIEDISKMARNVKSSQEFEYLNKELEMLKTGFNENLSKTETNKTSIQKNYSQAKDEMKKLRDEFDKLMTETENQAEIVKEEDLKTHQSVFERSNLIIGQLNKITSKLNKLKKKDDNENIFINMKRAENEIKSFEESLRKLESENTAREYKFETNTKLNYLMKELKVLGRISFLQTTNTSATSQATSISQQMKTKPTHVKDIKVSDQPLFLHGSIIGTNKHVLVTDYANHKVKLINTNKGTMISEIKVAGTPVSITKMKTNEAAVMIQTPNKIQILHLSRNLLTSGKEIPVNGQGHCYGIAYNDNDLTFSILFYSPEKVVIINMTGTLVRTIETDSGGVKLFVCPHDLAMWEDMDGMYVSSSSNSSVTSVSKQGNVKAVYKNDGLVTPICLCVSRSGVVYVVGFSSNTVHQLNPESGELTLLLDHNDGLSSPYSISYCEAEDKLYIGLYNDRFLKVFKMN